MVRFATKRKGRASLGMARQVNEVGVAFGTAGSGELRHAGVGQREVRRGMSRFRSSLGGAWSGKDCQGNLG